ncbi:MAG: hypothetical protein ABJB74_20530 [Gemmatimonas sp.]
MPLLVSLALVADFNGSVSLIGQGAGDGLTGGEPSAVVSNDFFPERLCNYIDRI